MGQIRLRREAIFPDYLYRKDISRQPLFQVIFFRVKIKVFCEISATRCRGCIITQKPPVVGTIAKQQVPPFRFLMFTNLIFYTISNPCHECNFLIYKFFSSLDIYVILFVLSAHTYTHLHIIPFAILFRLFPYKLLFFFM